MNIDRIEAAASRLDGHAVRTPLLHAPLLDEMAGRRVFVKAECLQKTGSFKYRGARSAISALKPEVRGRGVLAFSSGNHAQGVAHHAQRLGIPATIVMPRTTPQIKVDAVRNRGARVVLHGDSFDEAAIGTHVPQGADILPLFNLSDHAVRP